MKPSGPCMEANDPAAQLSFPNTACSSRAALWASGANLPLHLTWLGQHFTPCCQPTACSGICRQSWHGVKVLVSGAGKAGRAPLWLPLPGLFACDKIQPQRSAPLQEVCSHRLISHLPPLSLQAGEVTAQEGGIEELPPSSQKPQCLQPDPSTALQGAKPKGETPAVIRSRQKSVVEDEPFQKVIKG